MGWIPSINTHGFSTENSQLTRENRKENTLDASGNSTL
jgi:hypothetical protein